MENRLLGYKKFKSKYGKDCCVAIVSTDFSQYEKDHGCIGTTAKEIFLPDEQYNYLTPKDIGKLVETAYEVNGNRAYLQYFAVK